MIALLLAISFSLTPVNENMGWATGGRCSGEMDCTLSSQNFCARRGGVRELAYRQSIDVYACQTVCFDGSHGYTGCDPKPEPGPTPITLDPCDGDEGPPPPWCPQWDPCPSGECT